MFVSKINLDRKKVLFYIRITTKEVALIRCSRWRPFKFIETSLSFKINSILITQSIDSLLAAFQSYTHTYLPAWWEGRNPNNRKRNYEHTPRRSRPSRTAVHLHIWLRAVTGWNWNELKQTFVKSVCLACLSADVACAILQHYLNYFTR